MASAAVSYVDETVPLSERRRLEDPKGSPTDADLQRFYEVLVDRMGESESREVIKSFGELRDLYATTGAIEGKLAIQVYHDLAKAFAASDPRLRRARYAAHHGFERALESGQEMRSGSFGLFAAWHVCRAMGEYLADPSAYSRAFRREENRNDRASSPYRLFMREAKEEEEDRAYRLASRPYDGVDWRVGRSSVATVDPEVLRKEALESGQRPSAKAPELLPVSQAVYAWLTPRYRNVVDGLQPRDKTAPFSLDALAMHLGVQMCTLSFYVRTINRRVREQSGRAS